MISHQSYGTTPLDSFDEHDTDVMYEIDSDDSNSDDSDKPNVDPENSLNENKQNSVCKQPFIMVPCSPVMSRSSCERLGVSNLCVLQMDPSY
jgi:hypothetical protein